MTGVNMPDIPLSREAIDVLLGDLPTTPPKQVLTLTYAEGDRRECPECGAVVEAIRAVGSLAVSKSAAGEVSAALTSDAATCLPCGHEVRR